MPAGYRLKRLGQRDLDTQVVLASDGPTWSTWLATQGTSSGMQFFASETDALADFDSRMRA
jgi:hypothetical protein